MGRLTSHLQSPSLIVALVSLVFATGGTALATDMITAETEPKLFAQLEALNELGYTVLKVEEGTTDSLTELKTMVADLQSEMAALRAEEASRYQDIADDTWAIAQKLYSVGQDAAAAKTDAAAIKTHLTDEVRPLLKAVCYDGGYRNNKLLQAIHKHLMGSYLVVGWRSSGPSPWTPCENLLGYAGIG